MHLHAHGGVSGGTTGASVHLVLSSTVCATSDLCKSVYNDPQVLTYGVIFGGLLDLCVDFPALKSQLHTTSGCRDMRWFVRPVLPNFRIAQLRKESCYGSLIWMDGRTRTWCIFPGSCQVLKFTIFPSNL